MNPQWCIINFRAQLIHFPPPGLHHQSHLPFTVLALVTLSLFLSFFLFNAPSDIWFNINYSPTDASMARSPVWQLKVLHEWSTWYTLTRAKWRLGQKKLEKSKCHPKCVSTLLGPLVSICCWWREWEREGERRCCLWPVLSVKWIKFTRVWSVTRSKKERKRVSERKKVVYSVIDWQGEKCFKWLKEYWLSTRGHWLSWRSILTARGKVAYSSIPRGLMSRLIQ